MRATLMLGALTLLAGGARPLQAGYIANGDFSGGMAGWTAFATSNGTTGAAFGASSGGAYFQVGQLSAAPGSAGGGIFQNVNVGSGKYTISADLAAFNPQSTHANQDGGTVKLLVDGRVAAKYNFGEIGASQTSHHSLSTTLNLAGGAHEIRFEITRDYLANKNTPEQYLSNINMILQGLAPRGQNNPGGGPGNSGSGGVGGPSGQQVPMPEPGSLLLIGLGAVGMLAGLALRRGRPTPAV
jgi:hypothetical protein